MEKKDLRLVLCDIDSTLINSQRQLTPRTREAIEALHKKGIGFGLASGRPVDELIRNAEEWGLSFPFDYVIGMNGSELWDEHQYKQFDYYKLKKEWIKEIVEAMSPFTFNAFIYKNGDIYAQRMNDRMIQSARSSRKEVVLIKDDSELYEEDNAKIMFRMTEEDTLRAERYFQERPNPYYSAFKTQSTLLEFADKRISKGYALEKLVEMKDFGLENVASFGDTTNDNSMLLVSGLGVCMINGTDDTKAVADDITRYTHDEDGVAIYIEEHFL